MGHYRSEMVDEEDEQRERTEQAREQSRMARAIKRDIDKRGIAAVLADILSDPIIYKIGL